MIKKYKDYIILLNIFFLFIFASNINKFLSSFDKNLKTSNIIYNYDKYLKKELEDIRNFINININDNINLIPSKVKYNNIYNTNTITIYKGLNDSFRVGDAVLNNDGLIGIIEKCEKEDSVVRLINNNKSNISVNINDSSGILKVIDNNLVVTNISNYENIKVGSSIYTSSYSKIPEGIFVGTVSNITISNGGIEQIISVDINKRLDNLNYIYVWSLND